MSDIDNNEFEELSLADLAGIDVSEVAEVRYEVLPQMIADFEITSAEFSESTIRSGDNEGHKVFVGKVEIKVLEVKTLLDRAPTGVDKAEYMEGLAGKTYTEQLRIKPGISVGENAQEHQARLAKEMGRVRAFVTDVGGEWGANIVEAVENLKGVTFTGKIEHQTDKQDKTVKYPRLRLDAKRK